MITDVFCLEMIKYLLETGDKVRRGIIKLFKIEDKIGWEMTEHLAFRDTS